MPDRQRIEEGSCCMEFETISDSDKNDDKNNTKGKNNKPSQQSVFYNPVQVQNRDLSVLMIALFAERRNALETQRRQKQRERQKERAKTDDSFVLKETDQEWQAFDVQQHGICVLDALAASGLRSLRYWKECPGIKHVAINDLEEAATERARANVRLNGLQKHLLEPTPVRGRPYGICVQRGDATDIMYNSRTPNRKRPNQARQDATPEQESRRHWDVIDLDPYGSASVFLDAAVQAIDNGGLLNVTCTDMVVLGGSHPETAFGRYGSLPITRAGYLHEMAVRIVLYSLAMAAAKYGRSIKPILSVGMDFYVRVFVEVHDDKAGVVDLSTNVGHVYQSTQTPTFYVNAAANKKGSKTIHHERLATATCSETQAPLKVAGPIWMGPMHDNDVLREALKRLQSNSSPNLKFIKTKDRLKGLLTSCLEELQDVPLYYKLPELSKLLHCSTPSVVQYKAALVNAGYRASGYHKEPQAIKTDAPPKVVWDIMRAWVKTTAPVSKISAIAETILSVEPSIEVNFSVPRAVRQSNEALKSVARFPMNPEENWGPKPKATGKRKAEEPAKQE